MKIPPKMNRLLIIFLAAGLLGACASKPPEQPKFSVRGFSFLMPPKDKDKIEVWTLAQQTPDLVVLGRPGDYTGETLSVQMATVRLAAQEGDSLVRQVREAERLALDPKRFRVFRHDVKAHAQGTLNCVLSTLEAEDRAAAGPTGPVMSLSVESMTLTCPDPGKPTQGVSLSYIHQSYPEDKGKNYTDKALPILNSLSFGSAN